MISQGFILIHYTQLADGLRIKKIGNLYLVHLLKQGKGLKRFLHNYAINL